MDDYNDNEPTSLIFFPPSISTTTTSTTTTTIITTLSTALKSVVESTTNGLATSGPGNEGKGVVMFGGEELKVADDWSWIIHYVRANKEQALMCLLFSVAVGVACLLSAILCCVCCRWRGANKKGSFDVAEEHTDGSGKSKKPIKLFASKKKDKENESLLGGGNKGDIYKPTTISGSGIAAVNRPYSSPRSIKHEFARGSLTGATPNVNNTSTLTTPSSTLNHSNINTNNSNNTPTNAQVVGLYLSQAPKSRWSRSSDAVPWPIPPSTSSANEPLTFQFSGTNRSNPSQTQQMPIITESLPSYANNSDNPASIELQVHPQHSSQRPKLFLPPQQGSPQLQQPQQLLPQPQQPQQPQQQFLNSPTDYLFNRESINQPIRSSVKTDTPNDEVDSILRRSPNISINSNNSPSFPNTSINPPQRQTYPATNIPSRNTDVSSYSSAGLPLISPRLNVNSPPIVPAPASSPWPVRDSQGPPVNDGSPIVAGSSRSSAWNRRA